MLTKSRQISLCIVFLLGAISSANDRDSEVWGKFYAVLKDYATRLDSNEKLTAQLQVNDSQHDSQMYSIDQRLKLLADRLAKLWDYYPILITQLQEKFEAAAAGGGGEGESRVRAFVEDVEQRLTHFESAVAEIRSRLDEGERRISALEGNDRGFEARLADVQQKVEEIDRRARLASAGDEPTSPPETTHPSTAATHSSVHAVVFSRSQVCRHGVLMQSHVNMYGPDGRVYHGNAYVAHGKWILHAFHVVE